MAIFPAHGNYETLGNKRHCEGEREGIFAWLCVWPYMPLARDRVPPLDLVRVRSNHCHQALTLKRKLDHAMLDSDLLDTTCCVIIKT